MSDRLIGQIRTPPKLQGHLNYSGYETTNDYNQLINKPSIENITLIENKTLDDLGIQKKGNYANSRITNTELEEIFNW